MSLLRNFSLWGIVVPKGESGSCYVVLRQTSYTEEMVKIGIFKSLSYSKYHRSYYVLPTTCIIKTIFLNTHYRKWGLSNWTKIRRKSDVTANSRSSSARKAAIWNPDCFQRSMPQSKWCSTSNEIKMVSNCSSFFSFSFCLASLPV